MMRKPLPLQFPLYTLMVLDENNQGVPVAWSLGNSGKKESVKVFLQSVLEAAKELQSWSPRFGLRLC